MPEFILEGKVAIVTGGGRGLGRAAALQFAKEGASVVVVSRTEDEVTATAEAIGGGKAVAIAGDVGHRETARRAVAAALENFGRVDILMNNAAIVHPLKRIEALEELDWDKAVAANLKGPYLFSREVIPHMKKQGGGAIINVTSGLADFVLSPFGAYCITKAGLNQLTRILAEELREAGIAVNGLNPGVMDTRMQEEIRGAGPQGLGRETWQRFTSYDERGILDPPERAARLAVFLAAPPEGMTGEIGDADHFLQFGFREEL